MYMGEYVGMHLFDPIFFFFDVSVEAAACMFNSSWHSILNRVTGTQRNYLFIAVHIVHTFLSTVAQDMQIKAWQHILRMLISDTWQFHIYTVAAHTLRAWMTFQGALQGTVQYLTARYLKHLMHYFFFLWHLGALVWNILSMWWWSPRALDSWHANLLLLLVLQRHIFSVQTSSCKEIVDANS